MFAPQAFAFWARRQATQRQEWRAMQSSAITQRTPAPSSHRDERATNGPPATPPEPGASMLFRWREPGERATDIHFLPLFRFSRNFFSPEFTRLSDS
jgi:hypothetical protein